jgi:WD40 repeat protein
MLVAEVHQSLFSAGWDGNINIWSGSQTQGCDCLQRDPRAKTLLATDRVCFSPDSKLLVATGVGRIVVYDTATEGHVAKANRTIPKHRHSRGSGNPVHSPEFKGLDPRLRGDDGDRLLSTGFRRMTFSNRICFSETLSVGVSARTKALRSCSEHRYAYQHPHGISKCENDERRGGVRCHQSFSQFFRHIRVFNLLKRPVLPPSLR